MLDLFKVKIRVRFLKLKNEKFEFRQMLSEAKVNHLTRNYTMASNLRAKKFLYKQKCERIGQDFVFISENLYHVHKRFCKSYKNT